VAVNHVYVPDQGFVAQAINEAGAAQYRQGQDDRLRAIEQYNAQLEQRDQHFYDNLAYQQGAQALDYATNQDALGLRAYESDQNRMAGLADSQMRQEYGLADTALRGDIQAQLQGRQTAGQMARDMQNARLEQAMSEHDAIQKAWLDGEHFTSEDQFKQAKTAWEGKWGPLGLTWGLPDQIAAQQAEQSDAEMVGQLESTFFTSQVDGSPLIPQGAVQSMLKLGMEPKEIAALGVKMQAESTRIAGMKQKEGEAERKTQEKIQEKTVTNAQDTYKHGQQAHGDYLQAQAEHVANVAEYENKKAAHSLAMEEWEQAKKEWAAMPAPGEGKVKKPFTQARPSFTDVPPVAPLPMQFAGSTGFPVARSVAEVQQKLASGEWAEGTPFLTPDGQVMFARLRQQ